MQFIDIKNHILQKVIKKQEETLGVLQAQYERTRQEAIDAPGRMQSRYDSTKQELSYLAESLQKRIMQLTDEIRILKNFDFSNKKTDNIILPGALIKMQATKDRREIRNFLILPYGGGVTIKYEYDNSVENIVIVTPASPIYKSLREKQKGDNILVGGKELSISNIS